MLDLGQAPGSGGLHWPLLDKHVGPGRKSRLLKNKTRNFEADVTRVPSKSAAYLPFVCSIAADSNTRVRPHYARGRRGFRCFLDFFSCRHPVRFGHRHGALANFLRSLQLEASRADTRTYRSTSSCSQSARWSKRAMKFSVAGVCTSFAALAMAPGPTTGN